MDIKAMLKQIPLFRHLDEDELRRVEEISIYRSYRKKMPIFTEGSEREAVYFIHHGLVKTFKTDMQGNEHIVSLLKKGEMFPHTGFFDDTPYPATAEAMIDLNLVVIPIKSFEQLMLQNPTIAVKVMKIMGEKIRNLQETIQELTGQDVQHRILLMLFKLADAHGRDGENGVHIHVPITHQEFANMVGTRRETVNRVLNQLRKDGAVEVTRQGFIIHDISQLEKWL